MNTQSTLGSPPSDTQEKILNKIIGKMIGCEGIEAISVEALSFTQSAKLKFCPFLTEIGQFWE